MLDQVIGKHEIINYAVALDAAGAVRQLEILDYHESYGGEVHLPAWRRQFVGKKHGAPVEIDKDIKNISGATLSCTHVTEGVRRLLSTYALVLAPQAGLSAPGAARHLRGRARQRAFGPRRARRYRPGLRGDD